MRGETSRYFIAESWFARTAFEGSSIHCDGEGMRSDGLEITVPKGEKVADVNGVGMRSRGEGGAIVSGILYVAEMMERQLRS